VGCPQYAHHEVPDSLVDQQFTAAAILLLEERGRLKTDDPIRKYMPDAPAAWEKITIFHVLTHTGGIPDFMGFPDYAQRSLSPASPEQLVAWFKDKPLDFEPGTKFSYSNSGYVLLGYLIEKVSGEPYETFLKQNIFTPLGMKDSGYDSNAAIIERRAAGYSPGPAGRVNAGYVDMAVPLAAAGLYSTTHDLLKWEQGLFGGKVLRPESLAKMTTSFKENYGFGLLVLTTGGLRSFMHNGGIQGFSTSLAYYPDSRITVAVLQNYNSFAADEVLFKLGPAAHGQAVVLTSERRQITLPAASLSAYAGSYDFGNGKVVVTVEDGHLMWQDAPVPKAELFAESQTTFFLKVIDAQIEFTRNTSGVVAGLILHMYSGDIKAQRK
jgi:CubicO group peptidase (beta-lactamase class C family)